MSSPSRSRQIALKFSLGLICCFLVTASGIAHAQVRAKQPDRGTYHPPTIKKSGERAVPVPVSLADLDKIKISNDTDAVAPVGFAKPIANQREADLVETEDTIPAPIRNVHIASDSLPPHEQPLRDPVDIENVTYDETPQRLNRQSVQQAHQTASANHSRVRKCSCESCRNGSAATIDIVQSSPSEWIEGDVMCDGGCDAIGCGGCRGGCGSILSGPGWAPASLSLSRHRWFGSIELLMMARNGDRIPELVTTGPAADPDTAGQLGETDTIVLVGDETIMKDGVSGGRLTLGTWLNACQTRSMVFRGWVADEESFNFGANQDDFPVLARPFFNVTDGEVASQDTQMIVFPDQSFGSINVNAESDVFGGDISIRQLWRSGMGGSVDLLYGYQYMRLNESLGISTNSTSLTDDIAPVGSVIAVRDDFAVENEFHGGQLGIASMYREGPWSFSTLAKAGFGSLRRQVRRSGESITSVDGVSAFDPNGLLVRSTNAGTRDDDTFAWVPELDFTFGYHYFRSCDITVGYHIIAMTDALQVSGAIDPDLASNLAANPVGQLRPSGVLRFDTFYVQGIHLGLSYTY